MDVLTYFSFAQIFNFGSFTSFIFEVDCAMANWISYNHWHHLGLILQRTTTVYVKIPYKFSMYNKPSKIILTFWCFHICRLTPLSFKVELCQPSKTQIHSACILYIIGSWSYLCTIIYKKSFLQGQLTDTLRGVWR